MLRTNNSIFYKQKTVLEGRTMIVNTIRFLNKRKLRLAQLRLNNNNNNKIFQVSQGLNYSPLDIRSDNVAELQVQVHGIAYTSCPFFTLWLNWTTQGQN